MTRIAAGIAIALGLGWTAQCSEEPEGLLDRFLARIKGELRRLPDYVCTQTVERFSRPASDRPWTRADTLRLEVAIVGDRELYAPAGAQRFEEKRLADVVGRGSITTGQLGGFAAGVFLGSAARFTFHTESEQNGRRAFTYRYDVPPDKSGYVLRAGPAQATVGFDGEFWVDAETLDLLRLEVRAYDVPERLALAEASTSLRYTRVTIGTEQGLLPVEATFRVLGSDGREDLNHTRLTGCRHYQVESTVRTAASAAGEPQHVASAPEPLPIPGGALLEFALETNLDPQTASLGDPIRARLARPVRVDERTIVPEGAAVLGRLVRVEKKSLPFPMYEIGIEFDTLQVGGVAQPISATLEEAGPARGLLRQAKRLEPTFSRHRRDRMDILVREVQRGQGILHWDARHVPIPTGLRMKWRIEPARSHSGQQDD